MRKKKLSEKNEKTYYVLSISIILFSLAYFVYIGCNSSIHVSCKISVLDSLMGLSLTIFLFFLYKFFKVFFLYIKKIQGKFWTNVADMSKDFVLRSDELGGLVLALLLLLQGLYIIFSHI